MTSAFGTFPPGDEIVTDVAVLGSGGAGLAAAAAAADRGSDVLLTERSPLLGGTTAVSGGALWVPATHLAENAGYRDSATDALTYLRRITLGRVDDLRLVRFVEAGPEVVRWLVNETPVELAPMDFPDYHTQLPGSRTGGRTLDVLPFETAARLGLADRVRPSVHYPAMTQTEARRWRSAIDHDLVCDRTRRGVWTMGAGLAVGLVAAVLDRGVHITTSARARELVVERGRVVSVRLEVDDGPVVVRARRGVVVATGGFEWNRRLANAYLRGPLHAVLSPPWNTGDGLLMGQAAGGAVAGMSEAWWVPAVSVPGETYDGRPLSRLCYSPLPLPGSIMVNRRGRRFMDEALNYHDQGRAFHEIDSAAGEYPNLPAWLVFDGRFKRTYPVAGVGPDDPVPPWFHPAGTPEELAARVGVDPAGLRDCIDAFNAAAERGEDPDFGRGFSAHDRFHGDPERGTLAPLVEPPFHAVEVVPGCFGTKGGLDTDLDGRVLGHNAHPVPGLFAAGNAAVSVMGPGYPGAGGTLGPVVVGGHLAGRAAAG